jgi:hypothetical protein
VGRGPTQAALQCCAEPSLRPFFAVQIHGARQSRRDTTNYASRCGLAAHKDSLIKLPHVQPGSSGALRRCAQPEHPLLLRAFPCVTIITTACSPACPQIDQYTWDNPQFLPLFAGGNDRERRRCLLCSPCGPA